MRRITISDLCELTGYSRDQLRGLLAQLPRFADRHGEARVARVYSSTDVVLVVLLCRLETAYGLKRSVVSALCEPIAIALTIASKECKHASLVMHIQDATCEYADTPPLIGDGLVVALPPIFMAIESYLLPTPLLSRDVALTAPDTPCNSIATKTTESSLRGCTHHERKRRRSNHA